MKGKILFSRYKILDVIGKGSFSVVYKAIDLINGSKSSDGNNNFVAIKVIDMNSPQWPNTKFKEKDSINDLQDDSQNRRYSSGIDIDIQKKQLLREIEISKNVHHPNIVKCYDVFHEESNGNDIYYIVMEFFPSGSLLDYLKKSGKCLNEETSCSFFKQMVSAVSYLHSKNIIHRDIKFENFVLVNSTQIKLIDFGFSIQSTPSLNNGNSEKDYEIVNRNDYMRGTFCGSLAYSSPEIILHSRYSYSIDIWSLGVVLFGMIFGTFPFQGHGEILKNEILTSSTYFPKPISDELKNLINGMLRKNPKHRLTIEQVKQHEWISMFSSNTKTNFFINEISDNSKPNTDFDSNASSSENIYTNISTKIFKIKHSVSNYNSKLNLSNNVFLNSNQKIEICKSPISKNRISDASVSQQQLPQFISTHSLPDNSNNNDNSALYQLEADSSLLHSSQRNAISALSLNPFLILDKPEFKRYSSDNPKKIVSHTTHNHDVNIIQSPFSSSHEENANQIENFSMNYNSSNILKPDKKYNIFLNDEKLNPTFTKPALNDSIKLPLISKKYPDGISKYRSQKFDPLKCDGNVKQKNPFIKDSNFEPSTYESQKNKTPPLYNVKGKENTKKDRFINSSASLTFK